MTKAHNPPKQFKKNEAKIDRFLGDSKELN